MVLRHHPCTCVLRLLIALGAASATMLGQGTVDERIARVEQGVLPRAVPKGLTGKHATIADRMAYHGIPGMSMAVIEDGQLAWVRAYGVRGDGQGQVTPDTLFQAASLSKPVTALGAMLLVHQGHLQLDADVRKLLPSWTPGQAI